MSAFLRSRSLPPVLCLFLLTLSFPLANETVAADAGKLVLQARTRTETKKESGRWHVVTKQLDWDPKKTAIVICDMWDKHWCEHATNRVGEMAPRMNEVVTAARKQGVLIIHCPSDTMDFYKDTPQRKLAQQAPMVEAKVPLQRWCKIDPKHEGPLPVDDSTGGCDDNPAAKNYKAWSRQIATIEIKDGDAITDSAEAYYLMKQRGIENVIVMGVHTNMCVLGRPFSIRQMVYQGMNVVLMRDLTDSMYNPANRPFVSHFTGTELIVEHIEKYWCPTITSAAFLGGAAFRFAEDKRPHVVMIIGEDEYETERTLPEFGQKYLGKDFKVSYVFASEKDKNDFPGMEVLKDADLALISVRRRILPEAQLALLRKFVASGKPITGIRTASHAFKLSKGQPAAGLAEWPEFDRDVLGGNYTNHYPDKERVRVQIRPEAGKHPILTGIGSEEVDVRSSLYKNTPVSAKATVLMNGRIAGQKDEPVAWTHAHPGGGKVFYTSLGHVEDFKVPLFRRLLLNGIYWSAGLPVPEKVAVE